ncbi:MAG: hypothetical protein ACRD5W_00630 [Candidatus Acidiferrales bacterium]
MAAARRCFPILCITSLALGNETAKGIRFLKVQAGDMFLMLEVRPNSVTPLEASPQYPTGWISTEGQWEDGSLLKADGQDFRRLAPDKTRYRIVIRETEIEFK